MSPPSLGSNNKAEQETDVKAEPGGQADRLPPDFTLVLARLYCSTLKMEPIGSSETSVDFQRNTGVISRRQYSSFSKLL
jgi:hypothetical protein